MSQYRTIISFSPPVLVHGLGELMGSINQFLVPNAGNRKRLLRRHSAADGGTRQEAADGAGAIEVAALASTRL